MLDRFAKYQEATNGLRTALLDEAANLTPARQSALLEWVSLR